MLKNRSVHRAERTQSGIVRDLITAGGTPAWGTQRPGSPGGGTPPSTTALGGRELKILAERTQIWRADARGTPDPDPRHLTRGGAADTLGFPRRT